MTESLTPVTQELALDDKRLPSAEPSVGQMLSTFIERGITGENVQAFERLVALRERMEDRDAEKRYAAAFAQLQAEIPEIVAKTVIPNRGKYEKFEDVMHVLRPLMIKHGFSASFAMDSKDGRITETCHLRHTSGITKSNAFTVRVGRNADSETQADCKAATTAKRNALLNAFNIIIRQDALQNEEDDAGLEGETISPDRVHYLREQVRETGSNEAAFLKMAGATSYEEIKTGAYEVLVRALAAKAKR